MEHPRYADVCYTHVTTPRKVTVCKEAMTKA